MESHEREPLNSAWPNLEVIRDLKNKRHIRDSSPFWWSTDYEPDPREYLPFEEFKRRLVYFGECKTKTDEPSDFWVPGQKKEVYLYPEPVVPISILPLEMGTQVLPFLVTARPYHERELFLSPWPSYHGHPSLETLPKYIESGEAIRLPEHFYPHIRGLFAGKRGNHFFWYPLESSSLPPGGFFSNEVWERFESSEEYQDVFSPELRNRIYEDRKFAQQLTEALEKQNLSFLGFYDTTRIIYLDCKYSDVWRELKYDKEKEGLVDLRRTMGVDFPCQEVSAEEFIEGYQELGQDLLVYYPLRLPGIKSTLPLVIATRTHKNGKKKPAVLGIFADNGEIGRCRRAGILRIKDRELAKTISQEITGDFGISVDTVLFTSQKGRPKYERISTDVSVLNFS